MKLQIWLTYFFFDNSHLLFLTNTNFSEKKNAFNYIKFALSPIFFLIEPKYSSVSRKDHMTENLSTSSKPPLSDFPNHHKLSPKYPMETITLSEETSEIFHTDVNEFPSKSPQCRHAIVIPYFSCNDGISVKDDLTKSAKYLTMKSKKKLKNLKLLNVSEVGNPNIKLTNLQHISIID